MRFTVDVGGDRCQFDCEIREWPSFCGGKILKGMNRATICKADKNSTPQQVGEAILEALREAGWTHFSSVVFADNMVGNWGELLYKALPAEVKYLGATWTFYKQVVRNPNSGDTCFNVMICRDDSDLGDYYDRDDEDDD